MSLLLRRRALLSKLKKFLRKVTGIPPLSLIKCFDESSVVDYKIYGNSIQDGMPTPDTPVEVESVGERTINLYQPKNDKLVGAYSGFDMSGWEQTYYTLQVRLKEGKTIPSGVYFGFLHSNTQANWLVQNGVLNTSIYGNPLTTAINTSELNGVCCYPINQLDAFIDAFDVMLVKGNYNRNTMPLYEPYGYKIPVIAQGKNLFNVDNYGVLLDTNKQPYVLDIKQFPVGTKITISTKDVYYYKICNTAGGSGTYQYKANKYTITLTQKHIDLGYIFIINTTTFKPETKENLMAQNVQIEYGDTATEYEPYLDETYTTNIYLDEPLRGIDSYRDCIDFANGRVIKNIEVTSFSKSTGYIPRKNSNVCWFSMDIPSNTAHAPDTKILCKILKPLQEKWWIDDEGTLSHKTNTGGFYFSLKWERLGLVYDGTNVYRVEDTEKATPLTDTDLYDLVAEWFPSAFTQDERTVFYVRNTPTETQIELPQIPTIKDYTTVYTINTELLPSHMEVTYYSKESE